MENIIPILLIIFSTLIYTTLCSIRLVLNYNNRKILLQTWTGKTKKRWERFYNYPVIFILWTVSVRMFSTALSLYFILHNEKRIMAKMLTGGLTWYSFITMFEEIRLMIQLMHSLQSAKQNRPKYTTTRQNIVKLIPLILVVIIIPVLFLVYKVDFINFGMLIAAVFYLLYYIVTIDTQNRNLKSKKRIEPGD